MGSLTTVAHSTAPVVCWPLDSLQLWDKIVAPAGNIDELASHNVCLLDGGLR